MSFGAWELDFAWLNSVLVTWQWVFFCLQVQGLSWFRLTVLSRVLALNS